MLFFAAFGFSVCEFPLSERRDFRGIENVCCSGIAGLFLITEWTDENRKYRINIELLMIWLIESRPQFCPFYSKRVVSQCSCVSGNNGKIERRAFDVMRLTKWTSSLTEAAIVSSSEWWRVRGRLKEKFIVIDYLSELIHLLLSYEWTENRNLFHNFTYYASLEFICWLIDLVLCLL